MMSFLQFISISLAQDKILSSFQIITRAEYPVRAWLELSQNEQNIFLVSRGINESWILKTVSRKVC